jgi:hypothetical protein
MKADVLIAALQARGVTLVADGDMVRYRPKSACTPEDLDLLRRHKSELLVTLTNAPKAGEIANPAPTARPAKCMACQNRRFWRSVHGVVICAKCHPPAAPSLVAEWLDSAEGPASA